MEPETDTERGSYGWTLTVTTKTVQEQTPRVVLLPPVRPTDTLPSNKRTLTPPTQKTGSVVVYTPVLEW